MVEMAPVGDGLYRRGFAGDTFNTAWHMARWLGAGAEVGMVTRLGNDSLSDNFVAEMAADGMTLAGISRDPRRRMGLYLIELNGVERSFHYWRDTSAARGLADDPVALAAALNGVGLVHLSGITLAILPPPARETLFAALAAVRAGGGLVAFDPNIRPGLWASADDMRQTVTRMLGLADIALPSLDDEAAHFGDRRAEDTVRRMAEAGVAEVVVKAGAGPVTLGLDGKVTHLPTPAVDGIRDTTGAGDAFNAGYLAARVMQHDARSAVASGQRLATVVLSHFGARATKDAVAALPRL
jgi:2-dehydro-3-deoxygluconokinase